MKQSAWVPWAVVAIALLYVLGLVIAVPIGRGAVAITIVLGVLIATAVRAPS